MPKQIIVEDKIIVQIDEYKTKNFMTDRDLAVINCFLYTKNINMEKDIKPIDFVMDDEEIKVLDYIFNNTMGIDDMQKEIIASILALHLLKGNKAGEVVEVNFQTTPKSILDFADEKERLETRLFLLLNLCFQNPYGMSGSMGNFIEKLSYLTVEVIDNGNLLRFQYFSKIDANEDRGTLTFELSKEIEKYFESSNLEWI